MIPRQVYGPLAVGSVGVALFAIYIPSPSWMPITLGLLYAFTWGLFIGIYYVGVDMSQVWQEALRMADVEALRITLTEIPDVSPDMRRSIERELRRRGETA